MQSDNRILGNQLVVMSREDLDALVNVTNFTTDYCASNDQFGVIRRQTLTWSLSST